MLRKLLLCALSAFLAYQSVGLVRACARINPGQMDAWWPPLAALAIGLCVTGAFAFVGFVLPTHKLLPSGYYEVRRPRRLRRVCAQVGVGAFKWLLLWGYWGRPKHRRRFFDGTRSGLSGLIYMTKQAEFGHLGALIALIAAAAYLIAHHHAVIAGVVMVVNLVGNGYPILLQRLHRSRLARLVVDHRRPR